MDADVVARVKGNPKFHQLVSARRSFAWLLAAIMLAIYFGFILVLAFDKSLLAVKIGSSIISWGMPIGLGVIVSAFVLTGIYVRRANAQFDRLNREIVEESK
jgi:uncharacterized membrane protein (DUF485 family)